jgi:hypothetical protein
MKPFFLLIAAFTLPSWLLAQAVKPVPQRVRDLRGAGAVFEPVTLFSPAHRPHPSAQGAVRKAKFVELDRERLGDLLRARPERITLTLPTTSGDIYVDLYEQSVLSPTFQVETNLGRVFHEPGLYYRGCIRDDYSSLASFSFFEDEVMGFVSNNALGNLVVGRMDLPQNERLYVVYAEHDLSAHPHFSCTTRIPPGRPDPAPKGHEQPESVPGCIEVFIECDHELFTNKSLSVGNTVNYASGLFNQVATIFNNEQISTVISRIYVWVTPDNYSTSSSNQALDDFKALRTYFNGDLAHLFSLGGSGLGGIAYLDVLCATGYQYAFSGISSSYQNFPTYSWSVNVVAHEMGHNLGSHHTHWCGWPGGAIDNCYTPEGSCSPGPAPTNGGTIMSYCHLVPGVGVNFNNGFGPLPGDKIRDETQYAANNNCIPNSCPPAPSCNPPTNITVSNISSNSAQIGWAAVSGATGYSLQYRVVGTNTWTTVVNATSPHTLTGLNPDTDYECQLRSVCGSNNSPYYAGVIFTTAASACAAPTNLMVQGTTNSSATVDWTQNGPAPNEWEIEYGITGFLQGSGTTVTTTSKPYTITGLQHSTIYQCYVRANCGSSGYSAWAGPLTISMPLLNNEAADAILITVDASCPGINPFRNTGANTSGGEFNPIPSNGGYWTTGISHTVWFKFVAPPSGTVKITTDLSPQGTLNDTQVALYATATPSNYSSHKFLSSNEDGGSVGQGYNTVLYYTGLTPGTTYYVQVDGYQNSTGTFCIEVHETVVLPALSTTCTNYVRSVNGSSNPDKWFNIYTQPSPFDIGLPILAIKTGENLGNVTVKAVRTNAPVYHSSHFYMQRYFDISCTNNANSPKMLRTLYTESELTALVNASGYNGNAGDLLLTHYDGVNEDCTPTNNTGPVTVLTPVAVSVANSGVFFIEAQVPGFSEIGARFPFSPLPAELLAFDAYARERANLLEWRVGAEERLAAYHVERSADGFSRWSELGVVEARGLPLYRFSDGNPPDEAFYRLHLRDYDGALQYSPVVRVRRDGAVVARPRLGIRPNPADQYVYFHYRLPTNEEARLELIDAVGRVVLEARLPAESTHLELPLEALRPGVYFARWISASQSSEMLRFQVQR